MATDPREDMTAQDREDLTAAGDQPTPAGHADQPERGESSAAHREDAREPAGTQAPLVPDDANAQQPAGATPPGGPAKSTGDLLGERREEGDAAGHAAPSADQ